MKILSYRLLNEANGLGGAFQVGSRNSGLLGAKLISQQRGQSTLSSNYFEKTITLNLSIYELPFSTNSIKVLDYTNALFAINIDTDDSIFLYPYYGEQVKALTKENGEKWGKLKLYDLSGNPTDSNAYFSNPKAGYFLFNFEIQDQDTFNKVNKLYRFANLQKLEGFQNSQNPPQSGYYMGILPTSMSVIQRSGNQSESVNKYSLDIDFNPFLTAGTNTVNKIDGYCDVILNNVKGILTRNLPPTSFRNITYIKDGNDIYYIYTNDNFENNINTQKDCYVHVVGTGITQKTKYTLKTFNKI
jgi:hypothetical protein